MRRSVLFLILMAGVALGGFAIAQTAAKPAPTVEAARKFMDNAEAELLKLSTMGERAEWVDETYITDDTDLLTAAANDQLIARTTELVDQAKQFSGLNL